MSGKEQVIERGVWRVSLDPGSGRISIIRRNNPAPSIDNALIGLGYANHGGKKLMASFAGGTAASSDEPLEDVHGKGRQYRFTSTGRPDGLELTYLINLYDNRPFLLLRLEAANRALEKAGRDGCEAGVRVERRVYGMASVHRLEQHFRLAPLAHFANDYPVGPHPQGVAHQVADGDLAPALDARGPALERYHVRMVDSQLGGVLYSYQPLRPGNE
jgi:hypothetical protein